MGEVRWIDRLNTRFILTVSVVLILTLGFSQYIILSKLEETILKEEAGKSELLATGLMSSLQTLMLSGDGGYAHDWIERLSKNSEIKSLQIIRRDGKEAFLDSETIDQVNGYMQSDIFRRPPLPSREIKDIPDDKFKQAVKGAKVSILDEESERLTFLLPIQRDDECMGCHGYEENPIRGIMRITTSTSQAQERISQARKISITLGLLVSTLIGLLIFLIIRRQILAPLEKISSTTARISSGDFEARVDVKRHDELGTLGTSFNQMMENLRSTTVSKEYVESVMNALGEMVFVTDEQQRITTINPAVVQTLGYMPKEIYGQPMKILTNNEEFLITEEEETLYSTGKLSSFERTLRAKNGDLIPVLATLSLMQQKDGGVGIVFACRDITLQKQAERELQLAAKVMENDSNAILICDANADILLINPAFCEITGYEAEEVIGKNPRILSSGRQPKEFYQKMWETLLTEDHWEGEIWNRRKSGEIYPEYLSITVIRDEAGEAVNFVSLFTDITKQKQVERKLAHMAHHDVLTGLPNRALFTDRLTNLINQYPRYKQKAGVMFIDIDGFKAVNDDFGHDVGDALLVKIAEVLHHCIRKSDTLARVGGDEFVIIMENITSLDNVTSMAEKILKLFGKPFIIEENACDVGASIGIAIHPDDSEEAEELVKKADTAMYQAKTSGKGQYRIYSKDCVSDAD